MAFLVEDGTGLPLANSFASVDEADDYYFDRGDTTWTDADTLVKEAKLLQATQYLEATYRWKGGAATAGQGLAWPRNGVSDEDGYSIASNIVPSEVKDATIILAREAQAISLLPSQERGGRVTRLKTKLDVIEKETVWSEGASAGRQFPLIDGLLAGLIEGSVRSSQQRMTR